MAKSTDGKTLELDGVRVWFDVREGLQISVHDAELERELKSGLNSPVLSSALMQLLGKHELPNGQLTNRDLEGEEADHWRSMMDAAIPAELAGAHCLGLASVGLGAERQITITSWMFPEGVTSWTSYADHAAAITRQLRESGHAVADLGVVPVGLVGDDGKEIIGTVGQEFFRIWHSSKPTTWRTSNEYVLETHGHAVVMPLLRELSGGEPVLHWCGLITKPHTRPQVAEFRISNLNVERLLDEQVLEQLRDRLGVQWARLLSKSYQSDGSYVLAFGDDWRGREREFSWARPFVRTTRDLHLGEYGFYERPDGSRDVRDPNWWR